MTLERSYIGYLGFLGTDLFKSVLMYSNGAICLIKLLFKMGLFTVYRLSKFPIPMNQLSIKTPSPKRHLYWCLIEFIDWRYSQAC